jgi:hypothetical protein
MLLCLRVNECYEVKRSAPNRKSRTVYDFNMAHKLGISTHVEQLKSDPSLPAPLLLPRTAPLQSMTWVRAATVILRREPASVVYSSDQYEPKTHWNVNSE